MRAGRLRHRIKIQSKTLIQDPDTGAMDDNWIDIVGFENVPAEVTSLSGKEFTAAQAIQAQYDARILIRHCDIDTSNRILYDGQVFNITAVLPDDKSRQIYLTLLVNSGLNQG